MKKRKYDKYDIMTIVFVVLRLIAGIAFASLLVVASAKVVFGATGEVVIGAAPGMVIYTDEPVLEAEKEETEQKPFDAGKAQALRDARWHLKKIAEEMKVSVATVCKHTRPAKLKKRPPLEFS